MGLTGRLPSYWIIPQWMNWGSYNKSAPEAARARLYRWPSPEEALTMCLGGALVGARGFIFYSFFDMFTSGRENDFAERWPEICSVAEKLNELAPFLLGDEPATPLKPLKTDASVKTGTFRADDGREALVIVAVGPGSASAVFELPGEWESRCGRTKHENGKWYFAGNDISCDILYRK